MINPAVLRLRYPAFASVRDSIISYWLTDAERIVTADWDEAERDPATMALAAHNMAMAGALQVEAGQIPAGVTSFRSGSFSVTVSDAQASATGYEATIYGREFAAMLRRNCGGPVLVGVYAPLGMLA